MRQQSFAAKDAKKQKSIDTKNTKDTKDTKDTKEARIQIPWKCSWRRGFSFT